MRGAVLSLLPFMSALTKPGLKLPRRTTALRMPEKIGARAATFL